MAVSQAAISATSNADVANVNAVSAAIGTLQYASIATLAPLNVAMQTALSDMNSSALLLDTDIDVTTIGGVVAGLPAPQMVTTLLRQTSDVQQLSVLRTAMGYLARAAVNVAQAPG